MNANPAGASDGTPTPTADSPPRPSYIPKFSAATEMILQRLRGAGGPLAPNSQLSMGNPLGLGATLPPGYEDVKRSVMEGYKTTMNMSTPAQAQTTPVVKKTKTATKTTSSKTSTPSRTSGTPTTSSSKGKASAKNKGRGTKRKRAREESESPEESDMSGLGDSESDGDVTPSFPTQTLSGRKVVKPTQFVPPTQDTPPPKKKGPAHYNKKTGRNVEQALCKRCSRGNSPTKNQIVFCDQCNNGWHQYCHDPIITNEVVLDINAPWFCKDCTTKKAARANKGKKAEAVPPKTVPVAPSAPPTVVEAPRSGGWSAMSVEQKRSYLAQVPHQHLISMFIHATTVHPDLPVPPLPSPNSQANHSASSYAAQQARRLHVYPQQPFPPSATAAAGLFSRSESNPSATMNFIRKIPPGQVAPSGYVSAYNAPASLQHANSAPGGIPIFESAMDVDMNLAHELLHDAALEMDNEALHAQINDATMSTFTNGTGGVAEEEREESRESTPASPPYPKPGTGLMSRLKTDEEDLEWLVGNDEDEIAFSHTVLETGVGA